MFLCQYHTVLVTIAFNLKLGSMLLLALFFLRIAFVIQDLLWFHTDIKTLYHFSVKNGTGILIGIVLNL